MDGENVKVRIIPIPSGRFLAQRKHLELRAACEALVAKPSLALVDENTPCVPRVPYLVDADPAPPPAPYRPLTLADYKELLKNEPREIEFIIDPGPPSAHRIDSAP